MHIHLNIKALIIIIWGKVVWVYTSNENPDVSVSWYHKLKWYNSFDYQYTDVINSINTITEFYKDGYKVKAYVRSN